MRVRSLVPALLGLMLLLGGCATGDRVVTSQDVVENADGSQTYRVTWVSETYGQRSYAIQDPAPSFIDCYRLTRVGESLPQTCLSLPLLRTDSDAFNRNWWLAWASTLAVIVSLVAFSMRRIGWQPLVPPATGHLDSEAATGTPKSAVELMRSVEFEKESQVEAFAVGHDIPQPGWIGLGTGLVLLALLTLLVGYGTSLSLSLIIGRLMLLGVGSVATLLQFGMLPNSNMDPLIRRLFFLGGVMVALSVVSYFGLSLREPLLELNGVDWPF